MIARLYLLQKLIIGFIYYISFISTIACGSSFFIFLLFSILIYSWLRKKYECNAILFYLRIEYVIVNVAKIFLDEFFYFGSSGALDYFATLIMFVIIEIVCYKKYMIKYETVDNAGKTIFYNVNDYDKKKIVLCEILFVLIRLFISFMYIFGGIDDLLKLDKFSPIVGRVLLWVLLDVLISCVIVFILYKGLVIRNNVEKQLFKFMILPLVCLPTKFFLPIILVLKLLTGI